MAAVRARTMLLEQLLPLLFPQFHEARQEHGNNKAVSGTIEDGTAPSAGIAVRESATGDASVAEVVPSLSARPVPPSSLYFPAAFATSLRDSLAASLGWPELPPDSSATSTTVAAAIPKTVAISSQQRQQQQQQQQPREKRTAPELKTGGGHAGAGIRWEEDRLLSTLDDMYYTLEADYDDWVSSSRKTATPVEEQEPSPTSASSVSSAPAKDDEGDSLGGRGSKASLNERLKELENATSMKYLWSEIEETGVLPNFVDVSEVKSLLYETNGGNIVRSKWYCEYREGQDVLYDKCEKVLELLRKYTLHSTPFLQPVSRREYPEYYNYIKNPMDLSTVAKKLKEWKYDSKEAFKSDLYLIYSNCRAFNGTDPQNPYTMHANEMQRKTDVLLAKVPDITIRDRRRPLGFLGNGAISSPATNQYAEFESYSSSSSSATNERVSFWDDVYVKTSPGHNAAGTTTPAADSFLDFSASDSNHRVQQELQGEDREEERTWYKQWKSHLPHPNVGSAFQTRAWPDTDLQVLHWRLATSELRARRIRERELREAHAFPEQPALARRHDTMGKFWKNASGKESLLMFAEADESDDAGVGLSFRRDPRALFPLGKKKKRSLASKGDSPSLPVYFPEDELMSCIPYADLPNRRVFEIAPAPYMDNATFSHDSSQPILKNVELLNELQSLRRPTQQANSERVSKEGGERAAEKELLSMDLPNFQVAGRVLMRSVVALIRHSGAEKCTSFAVDLLADILASYIMQFGKLLALYSDNVHRKLLPDRLLQLCLSRMGVADFRDLDRYICQDIVGYGRYLKDSIADIQETSANKEEEVAGKETADELENDGVRVIFGKDSTLDFFGLEELGLGNLAVPNFLLRPLVKATSKLQQNSNSSHGTTRDAPFETPASFKEISSADDHIKLLAPFLRRLLAEATPAREDHQVSADELSVRHGVAREVDATEAEVQEVSGSSVRVLTNGASPLLKRPSPVNSNSLTGDRDLPPKKRIRASDNGTQ